MAGDNIDHTIGNAGLGNQGAKFKHRRRGMFRGFQNNRVASGQCRPDLDRAQKQLRIPRHNRRNHTQWFPVGKDKHVRLVDWQCFTRHLVGSTCIEMQIFGNIFCLPPRFLQHLAGVGGFHRAEFF